MVDTSPRTGLLGGRAAWSLVAALVAALVLVACSGSLDIDPSTIGGAEPEDLVGDDPQTRRAPTLVLPDADDDGEVPRPDDLDALQVGDDEDPWYLADGTTRAAVGDVVTERLADLDAVAVCAYLAQEITPRARARLMVPASDVAYPPGEPAAASRLTDRAAADLLADELGVRDLRVAASIIERCELGVDLELARIAARSGMNRALDLPGSSHVDPRDDGWATADPESDPDSDPDSDPGSDPATGGTAGPRRGEEGRPAAVEAGPRDADVLAAWEARLAPRAEALCAWVGGLPQPRDLDTVLLRLVQLRNGVAHDGLPSAAEALAVTCPSLASLAWSAAVEAEALDDGPGTQDAPAGAGVDEGPSGD